MNGNKSLHHGNRKRNSLPPHTWEAHPKISSGETNKTFLIVLISIALVIILILFLFIGSKFVGKAIEGRVSGAQIDIQQSASGQPFIITATLPAQTSTGSVYFELTSNSPNVNLCTATVTNTLWNQFYDTSCTGNTLRFGDATLNEAEFKSGTFTIAIITLAQPPSQNFELSMPNVDVYNGADGTDFFPQGGRFPFIVSACTPAGRTEECGRTVGICVAGRQTCQADGTWSACSGAIVPESEICDQRDNDCDGTTDEDNICNSLSIASSAFDNGDAIPADFTCSERDASPPLTIRNIPATARSLALIMDDSYNPALPYIHWVVLNIPLPTPITPATVIEIPAGSVPSGATVLANEIDTTNRNTYAGPCPPEGEIHTYRFTAYALSNPIANPLSIQGQSPVLRKSTFESSIGAGIVSSATLNGVYFPPPVMESPRSGGGFSCSSQWSCASTWGYCNATLQQSRTCTDLNRCDQRKLTKLENKSCTACEESWVCTPWNACQNGQQTRNCADEHSCGAVLQKPALQKSCQVAAPSGPAPVRVQPQLPLPVIQEPAPVPTPSFWDTYKWFVTGIPAALVVIVLIIFGIVHAFRPKAKPAAAAIEYNISELKEWVQKEKQMGTSPADIETLLTEHTGWSREEIESKFGELKEVSPKSPTV